MPGVSTEILQGNNMKIMFLVMTIVVSQVFSRSAFSADNFDYIYSGGYKNANLGTISGADSSCFSLVADNKEN